ncbi:MAG: ComF family protein [Desulfatiglandaceae bacterium]
MNLWSQFIDIIYPPRCAICREFLVKNPLLDHGTALPFCPACAADFRPLTPPLCPICGTPFGSTIQDNHPCGTCLARRPWYDAAGAPYLYDGTLLKAIYGLKYGKKNFLADALGPVLATFAKRWVNEAPFQLVMPVPLHKKRLRERGFNQSLLLARPVAKALAAKLDFLSLKRVKHTLPQTGLTQNERRKNIRRAFQVIDEAAVRKKAIVLVDDVATTGNTLNECARVLKRAGAGRVHCLTLARAANM